MTKQELEKEIEREYAKGEVYAELVNIVIKNGTDYLTTAELINAKFHLTNQRLIELQSILRSSK